MSVGSRNINYTRFPQDVSSPNLQIQEPLYDTFVLRTNEENVTRGRIGTRYVVDSRERDHIKYPEPNNYRISVPEEYRELISAQLVQAVIPHSPYNITNSNNKIIFQEAKGNMLETSIPIGFYANIMDILTEIEDSLNQAGDSSYTVTLIPIQNRVRIVSSLTGGNGVFYLYDLPGTNTVMTAIGMQNLPVDITGKIKGASFNRIYGDCTRFTKDLTVGDSIRIQGSDEVYTVTDLCSSTEIQVDRSVVAGYDVCGCIYRASYTGRYSYDLSLPPYTILNIPEFHKLKSVNKHIDDAYAIIPVTSCTPGSQNSYTVIDASTQPAQREITYFNPPLASLIYMTIRFTDSQGNLYDFQGRDHLLVFEFMALNQPGKYNLIGDV